MKFGLTIISYNLIHNQAISSKTITQSISEIYSKIALTACRKILYIEKVKTIIYVEICYFLRSFFWIKWQIASPKL